jgi:tRNA-specific 2-thiouridylase
MCPTTAIALSGGIDSLVSAALLKEQGHQLIGLHFLTGYETAEEHIGSDPSKRIQDQLDAMADQLHIPVHIIDLQRDFKRVVVDYFATTYRSGRTPNPCLVCNPLIKFDILFRIGRSLGAQAIASGHYARIQSGQDGRRHLYRGVDHQKDQSYFLARLTQSHLSRAILPLGALTKDQTRQIASQKGLKPVASEESQDICFIKNGHYAEFIEHIHGFFSQPGHIEDLAGNIIGRHDGLHRFTIGQRRGINCPAKEPYYVHHMDVARSCLVVCFKKDMQVWDCHVSDINWITPCPHDPVPLKVRVRYRHSAVPTVVTPLDDHRAHIRFETPQEAVTPGQGAVFYQDDEVLGAGWIE